MTAWVWRLAERLAAMRAVRFGERDVRRHDWPTDAQRLGLRFDERVRGSWRPRWLRLSRGNQS